MDDMIIDPIMEAKVTALKKLLDASVANDEEAMKVDALKLLEDIERMKIEVSEALKIVETLDTLSQRQSEMMKGIVEAINKL